MMTKPAASRRVHTRPIGKNSAPTEKAKILVIEDQVEMFKLIEMKLSRLGYKMRGAVDGKIGLEAASSWEPDLILLDVMLPEMDGWEVCRQIRKTSSVPIIMLTAKNTEDDIIQGLTTGADEYVTKPFGINTLPARIDALLRRTKWQDEIVEKELNDLKHNITSAVTHELRTPLALILHALELAMRENFRDDSDSQLEFIRNARRNAITMRWLVDDLLMLVRMDQGVEIFRRPTQIRPELDRLGEMLENDIKEKELSLIINCSEYMLANLDQTLFRHATYHLLSNAVKFSPKGGSVHLKIEPLGNMGAELVVVDQGGGIAPEYHKAIFERFYQINKGHNRRYGGLGIGLPIARAIADAHGGEINLTSVPGTGSAFSMQFPNAKSDWEF